MQSGGKGRPCRGDLPMETRSTKGTYHNGDKMAVSPLVQATQWLVAGVQQAWLRLTLHLGIEAVSVIMWIGHPCHEPHSLSPTCQS